jgi:hypothetical protein
MRFVDKYGPDTPLEKRYGRQWTPRFVCLLGPISLLRLGWFGVVGRAVGAFCAIALAVFPYTVLLIICL